MYDRPMEQNGHFLQSTLPMGHSGYQAWKLEFDAGSLRPTLRKRLASLGVGTRGKKIRWSFTCTLLYGQHQQQHRFRSSSLERRRGAWTWRYWMFPLFLAQELSSPLFVQNDSLATVPRRQRLGDAPKHVNMSYSLTTARSDPASLARRHTTHPQYSYSQDPKRLVFSGG